MITKFKTHKEIPTSLVDNILTMSGETNIKQVPLEDINGFVELMEGVDSGIKEVNNKIPVIAGCGSNATHEALELTEHAKKVGADYALVITPYYNKPTQEGLFQHFKKIADSVSIPIIMYNVPGRTGINLLPETVARCYSECSNILGIKEASGSLDQITKIISTGDGFSNLARLERFTRDGD